MPSDLDMELGAISEVRKLRHRGAHWICCELKVSQGGRV